ncbi:NrsF family protein [Erythrobacter sp. Alg231-14]|uniref:NrsF family protein n=1 Tax=Erythrobacter sp. Alg231-14 TaxID=1922225 RepID=UPI000D562385
MNTPPTNPPKDAMSREDLIASLTEDLTPVKRVKPVEGVALIAFATVVALVASIAVYEWWGGLLTGEASGYFIITHGLLLVLGAASTAALVTGAMPRVGTRANAPLWSAIMLAILPAGAIINLMSGNGNHAHEGLNDPVAYMCTMASLSAGALVLIAAVLFLRRGAPVSIERSAWLSGLAAGSLGTLAYGITCPLDTFSHVGLWHVAPVAIGAVFARIVVPPLIRW